MIGLIGLQANLDARAVPIDNGNGKYVVYLRFDVDDVR